MVVLIIMGNIGVLTLAILKRFGKWLTDIVEHCGLVEFRRSAVDIRVCSDAVCADSQVVVRVILVDPGQAVFSPEQFLGIERLKSIWVHDFNAIPTLFSMMCV